MNDNKIDVGFTLKDHKWKNVVSVASGTFGYAQEYSQLIDINKLGAIFTKALSPNPRFGNKTPRIAQTPSGMLNAIGLTNQGVDNFITTKMDFIKTIKSAVYVNVAGSTSSDYIEVVEKLSEQEAIKGFEINLSCPNVKSGCLSFGTNPILVEEITKALRGITNKALIIKLTPNVTDICEIAKAAEAGGADAISCINTLLGMAINIEERRPYLANKTGGLSGAAIKPVGVAAVYKVSKAVTIPVIGMGGISSGEDAIEYLLAGASAIEVGTALFTNPNILLEIIDFIEMYMSRHNFNSIKEMHNLF